MQNYFRLSLSLIVLTWSLFLAQAAADEQNRSDASLFVEKPVICRGVDQRTPIGIGNVFSSDAGKLYCFTKVVGATKDTKITHRWFLNGELKSSVTLPVRSSSWRTWSSRKIELSDAGDWMVEIVAQDGAALATIIFFIQ